MPVIVKVNKFDDEAVKGFYEDFEKCLTTGQPFVPILIDSYGGQVYSLLSMMAIIQNSKFPVYTIVQGKAMSCGAILFGMGHQRYMSENATLMLHDVSTMSCGKVEEIKSDAKEAESLLTLDKQPKGLNYRFSKSAIYSLESRIYLYMQQWEKSQEAVNKALAINNTLIDLKATPVLATKYDSKESILALEINYANSIQIISFASNDLIDAYDKTTDLRFPIYFSEDGSKFIIEKGAKDEQKCSFRTSELYLTKAETSLKLDNLADAKSTILSFIKNRYTASGFTQLESEIAAMNAADLTTFILAERQREFAVEGQRWFDLRRTTQKQIIHTFGGQEYTLRQNDPRYTIPFPANARLNNPNL